MKGNWFNNVLLAACLIVLIGGQISNKGQAAIQPALAAEAPASISAPLAPAATSGAVSVSAAAFQPFRNGATYSNYYYQNGGLINEAPGVWTFIAPVNLPQGAIVDQVVCYMKDSSTYVGNCRLGFNLLGIDSYQVMAYTESSGSSGSLVGYEDNDIDFDTVNNELNAYAMMICLNFDDVSHYVSFHGAKIHYHYNAMYLPSVRK